MRLLLTALAVGLTLSAAKAQEEEEPLLSPRERLIQELFESETAEALAANTTKALAGGLPQQAILEARFLFLVDQQDFGKVADLAPSLEKQKESFRIEDSVIFSVPEEFHAIIQYCHALAALEKGDQAGFKKHITEAFWLSPRQASAFAPHIERLRLDQAMKDLTIDFQVRFASQLDGADKSLAALTGTAGHTLLHFWSPWSNECEAFLPDFLATTRELARHQVAVVSVLVEPSAEALEVAREFRASIKEKPAGEWIVDNSKAPLARQLRIQDLPTVVLLDARGRVLFNGHPAEDELWTALRKAVPDIERPRLAPGPDSPE